MKAEAPVKRFCLSLLIAPALALGDSPLTSTDWHLAYPDVPAVARVQKAQLDDQTFATLRDPATPFEVRAAIISAGGGRAYASRLKRATGSAEPSSAVDLFNLGFITHDAEYLDRAARLEPHDQAVAMARALVHAQRAMEDERNWCEVFRLADAVANRRWRRPMRPAAVEQIMRYMRSYQPYCEPRPVEEGPDEDEPDAVPERGP